ncbi:MAG: tryptophan synthase subunit beta, partial [Clostridia bacterium]|nr:tryptophan synthase subunit beta [Clostridia bacterium]
MNKYKDFENYLKEYPSEDGYFGEYGGSFQAKELIEAFKEADDAYEAICHSAQFINELRRIRKEFQGRPTPVYHCERLSKIFGNCQIYLK